MGQSEEATKEEKEMTLMGKVAKKMGSVAVEVEKMEQEQMEAEQMVAEQMKAGKMEVGMKAAETVAHK